MISVDAFFNLADSKNWRKRERLTIESEEECPFCGERKRHDRARCVKCSKITPAADPDIWKWPRLMEDGQDRQREYTRKARLIIRLKTELQCK